MLYADIVASALSYSDRYDAPEVVAQVDNFLRMVEARVNRVLQTRRQSRRAELVTTAGQDTYGLPPDFAGLRNIEYIVGTKKYPMKFMAPEMLDIHALNNGATYAYTILGNSISVFPTDGNNIIEITYFQQLVPLTSAAPENWLSRISPDAYIQGLLVEINAFVKDAEASAIWEQRFRNTLADIQTEDSEDRWSGPSLTQGLL
jgi:hypothetical protein